MNDNRWFAAWVIVGFGLAFGVISFAAGPLLLVPAGLAAAFMIRSPNARRAAHGALTGAGVLLLSVAYLNRDGPGTTCWQHGSTSGCDRHLNPLPWVALGLVLVAGGFIAQRLRHR